MGMEKDGDAFFECRGDGVAAAFEFDGVVGVDAAGGSQGEVEVEEGVDWTGADGRVGLGLG